MLLSCARWSRANSPVGVSAYQTGCIWRMGQQDLSSRRGHDRPFTQRRSLFGTSREGTTLVAQARAAFAFAHPCSARHGSSRPRLSHGIGQSIGGSKVRTRPSNTSPICANLRSRSQSSFSLCTGSIRQVDLRLDRITSIGVGRWRSMTRRRVKQSENWRG
jgi:hypothetical protein